MNSNAQAGIAVFLIVGIIVVAGIALTALNLNSGSVLLTVPFQGAQTTNPAPVFEVTQKTPSDVVATEPKNLIPKQNSLIDIAPTINLRSEDSIYNFLQSEGNNGIILIDQRLGFESILEKNQKTKQQIEGLKKTGIVENISKAEELEKNLTFSLKAHKNKIKAEQERLLTLLGVSSNQVHKTVNMLNTMFIPKEAIVKNLLNQLPGGVEVYPNATVYAMLMDSVPLINANDVWKLNRHGSLCLMEAENPIPIQRDNPTTEKSLPHRQCLTGKGIRIGIIDTGVDYTHPDLGGCIGLGCKVLGGWDFVNNDADPIDDMGHGTHVAATAAGNGILKGVAPEANIYAYKVLNSSGSGYTENIILAVDRSFDVDGDGYIYGIDPEEDDPNDILDVINLSLGGIGGADDPLSLAVDNAVENGIIAVVSAGNSGPYGNVVCRNINYPEGTHHSANCSPSVARNAISVGAGFKKNYDGLYWGDINPPTGKITGFSSRGPGKYGVLKPDLSAPGAVICAAEFDDAWSDYRCLDESHVGISGTSMASPHVAGIAALLKQQHPDWSPLQIKSLLKHTAVSYNNPFIEEGVGMVDGLLAVQYHGIVPVIEAELSTDFYESEPFTLTYSVGYNPNQSMVKIDRAIFSSYDFKEQDLAWELIYFREFSSGEPQADALTIDFANPESTGEVYRVTVTPQNEESFEEYLVIGNAFINNDNYAPGWPKTIQTPNNSALTTINIGNFRGTTTMDIAGDIDTPYPETLALASFLFDYQGQNNLDISGSNTSFVDRAESLFFVNVDQDGQNELFADGILFDDNGQVLFNEQKTSRQTTVADLDGDGQYEIININDNTQGMKGIRMSFLSQSPIVIDYGRLEHPSFAVGDLFNDGGKDIVYTRYNGPLMIANFHTDGTYQLIQTTQNKMLVRAIADLDGDGTLELICSKSNTLFVLKNLSIQYSATTSQYNGSVRIQISDVSGDESPEILAVESDQSMENYDIRVYDNQLNLLVSIPLEEQLLGGNFFLYDFDFDQKAEIMNVGKDRLYVYSGSGQVLSDSIPITWITNGLDYLTGLVIGDTDADGKMELFGHTFGAYLGGGSAKIYGWKLPFTYQENEINWLKEGYDNGRTYCYRCNT
ncbi:MAG: S8 family serine peptidase [Candidatus ainarchaeum sp.]|nr:S8 family serine peptidase [Candidatus ainarchaeum sp.]